MSEPARPETQQPAAPAIDSRDLWAAMVAVSEATISLRKARDLLLASRGNTLAAASLHILHEACAALALEQGQEFRMRATAGDATARLLCDRLAHMPPPIVPPEDRADG